MEQPMNTAIAITLIIAVAALASSGIQALRDIAKAKHQNAKHCTTCTCHNSKETSA
jgi:hypothetical protein